MAWLDYTCLQLSVALWMTRGNAHRSIDIPLSSHIVSVSVQPAVRSAQRLIGHSRKIHPHCHWSGFLRVSVAAAFYGMQLQWSPPCLQCDLRKGKLAFPAHRFYNEFWQKGNLGGWRCLASRAWLCWVTADVYMCWERKINQFFSVFGLKLAANWCFCVIPKTPALQVNLEVRMNF